jgi:hypothetical protein
MHSSLFLISKSGYPGGKFFELFAYAKSKKIRERKKLFSAAC